MCGDSSDDPSNGIPLEFSMESPLRGMLTLRQSISSLTGFWSVEATHLVFGGHLAIDFMRFKEA